MKRILAVVLDDRPLDPSAAREIWDRFSLFMDSYAGASVDGYQAFAAQEGVASVRPTVVKGTPTLIVMSRVER
jgi:hypothetical protein